MTDVAKLISPSLDDLATIVEAELNRLRPALGRYIDGVPIQVADFPEDEVLQEMGCETPFDLMGLYQGGSFVAEDRAEPVGNIQVAGKAFNRSLIAGGALEVERLGARQRLLDDLARHADPVG